jgi:hypothetical protein
MLADFYRCTKGPALVTARTEQSANQLGLVVILIEDFYVHFVRAEGIKQSKWSTVGFVN